jgi:hypothetical protein
MIMIYYELKTEAGGGENRYAWCNPREQLYNTAFKMYFTHMI